MSYVRSMGSQAIGHDLAMNTFTLFFKGRGGLAQLVPTAPTPLHHKQLRTTGSLESK